MAENQEVEEKENYLVRCVKTGNRVGKFLYVAHGKIPVTSITDRGMNDGNFQDAECGNCGRPIKWLYFFENADNTGQDIVLGSECAKNVPKFSQYYREFKLFKEKVDLLCKLSGKKKSDLLKDVRFATLHIIEKEIEQIKQKKEQEIQAKLDTQKEFAERLQKFAEHNTFLNSLYQQYSNRHILTEKQLEIGKKVMDETEPIIDRKIQTSDILQEQSKRIGRFVKGRSYNFGGSFSGFWNCDVRMDKFTMEMMISFYEQLEQNKTLSDKQLGYVAKSEHRYRKQLEILQEQEKKPILAELN
jgi:hypothetical protein